jgi:UDP-2,3-diacylglucosamine pyrophosphatase LpxH
MYRSRTFIKAIEPPLPDTIWACGPGDVHLGADNRSKALLELLSYITCEVLVLNGDFIDHANLERFRNKRGFKKKNGEWEHTGRLRRRDRRVIQRIEKMREAGTRVIYIHGNHDEGIEDMLVQVRALLQDQRQQKNKDFWDMLLALRLMGNWEHCHETVLERNDVKYFFTHGDAWDHIVHSKQTLTGLGAFFWEVLKGVEREKHTVAQFVKRRVKRWTQISNQVAAGASAEALFRDAQYAFAGHTHDPWRTDIKVPGKGTVNYVNIGSFDLHESGFFTITPEGVVTLHRVYAHNKHIGNPRHKKPVRK